MIFVSVGTQKFSFNRLLKKLDKMVRDGIINENIYAQIGYSDYKPQNFNYKEFMDVNEFLECISKSSLVITHSGVGCIINCLNNGKPVIVVPRKKEYGEHVDDHQIEIAKAFEQKNLIVVCENIDELDNKIENINNLTFETYESGHDYIIEIIEEFIIKNNKCCS